MPSKGGSTGQASAPQLSTPTGLWQDLSSLEGVASFGQNTFNPLASMTNWAADIATGGNATPIGNFQDNSLQTGPQVTIGGGGDKQPGHYAWTTQFNPQTGQVTFTNSQTGEQFQEAINSSQAQQYLGPEQVQQWTQLYNNRGASAGGTGTGTGGTDSLLGPQLGEAWNQIQSLAGQETATENYTTTLENQAATEWGQGENMLRKATTGTGLYPSQEAYVKQATQAEESQLAQQLSSEGLGSSTSNQILQGEAKQQGAATAGGLIQGNISAAQQQLALAQGTQKLVQGEQQLTDAEMQAVSSLSMTFQGTMFQEALSGYGALSGMMSTIGNLYGIDVSGYSAIMNAENQNNQIQAQLSEANAGLLQQASSSMGSGLGSLLGGLMGGGGGGGGGGLGGILGGLGGSLGGLFGGGGAAAAGAGGAGATAGITDAVVSAAGLIAAF